MEKQQTEKAQHLIHRVLGFIDNNEMKLLLLDHGITVTDEQLEALIQQELVSRKQRRQKTINDNIDNYKISALYNGAKQRAEEKGLEFNLTKE